MDSINRPEDDPLSMEEYNSIMRDVIPFHEVNGITYARNDEKYHDVYFIEGNDIGHAWSTFNLIK